MNTKSALMGTARLALATATLVATQLGCGGADVTVTTPPGPKTETTVAVTTAPAGDDDVVVADFTEPLGNYGVWVDDAKYGKVWQPADDVAGADFVPYAGEGSWSANDDGAWVYESKYDTEFGWATYHYGRWVENDDYGWVWIPGTTWAPSWVDWRYGGGNVGWAPMGPEGVVVEESRWSFVDQVHFCDPGWRTYRLAPERVHVAFEAAPLISVGVGGGAAVGGGVAVGVSMHFGPPVASIKAAGGAVRTSHVAKPARGAVKAQATASVQRAKSTNRPKSAAAPVKRGPATRAARGAPGAEPAKEHAEVKGDAKPGAKVGAKPGAKEAKPERAENKPVAKPAAAKPKPEEKEKPKPAPKPAPKKK